MSALARKLKQAQDALQRGDVATAHSLCNKVLRTAPRNPDALYLHALIELMNGRPQAAIAPLEQVIAHAPRHGPALENLGLALLMAGEYARAEAVLKTAAALPGAPASVDMRLGLALLYGGRRADAIAGLTKAHAKDRRDPLILVNLGQAHAGNGDPAAARSALEQALAVAPDHPDALYNLGVLDLEAGALDGAENHFVRTLRQAPEHVDALVNLAVVALRRGAPDRALETLDRAAAIAPHSSAVHEQRGHALMQAGDPGRARDAYAAALAAAAPTVTARAGMVAACYALERYGEGVGHARAVAAAAPDNAAALAQLAQGLFQTGALDEARDLARRTGELDPEQASPYALVAQIHIVRNELEEAVDVLQAGYDRTRAPELLSLYAHQLRRLCDWDRWTGASRDLLAALPHSARLGSPFSLLSEYTTAEQQLDYTRRWAADRFAKIAAPAVRFNAPETGRRLRVGYITSDFYEHPVGYLLAEVLELHNRERFEIFAYSYGPDDGSTTRKRYEAAAEHFVDIARVADDLAYRRIVDDKLDLLIDLHGYTVGDRLAILARRPCARQATWLGYPCTTGASFIDYLIADPHVIPPGADHRYASERVVRLPHCYQPNDRRRPRLPSASRADYELPAHGFVFCCFNQLFKITPAMFGCWMDILRDVDDSVLWLMLDHPAAAERLRQHARAAGIDPARLVFAPRIPLAQHLARYGAADLALDTFPYTSHTTASDALWAGCPLVALRGDTFPARVSASILVNAGLADYITDDLDTYRSTVVGLARDTRLLATARARVAAARTSSALFDTPRFTRELETLFQQLILG